MDEPVYEDRKISEWIGDYNISPEKTEAAMHVLRENAETALPWLMKEIQCKPSPLMIKFRDWLGELPFTEEYGDDWMDRLANAALGISMLEEKGAPAKPMLIDLLKTEASVQGDLLVLNPLIALSGLGEGATEPFLFALNHDASAVRYSAAIVFNFHEERRQVKALRLDVIESLAKQSRAVNVADRVRAVQALELFDIGDPPRVGDPAAIEICLPCLTDSDSKVRAHAAWSLYRLDHRSTELKRALTEATWHPDSRLVDLAVHALEEIASESKTKESQSERVGSTKE
ncbi:MAG: hypothetical protein ACI9VS_001244 [Candidatus Binatia bacterium]|jgi:hypothetical protein